MSDNTKLTVYLTPRAVAAMDKSAELTGLSKTDCVNRALQVYAWWLMREAEGLAHLLVDEDGVRKVNLR